MPARFPSGLTTVHKWNPLGEFGLPDPTQWHVWFDDFDDFAAAQWIITTTEAGGGSATEAVNSADGGILLITNDNADNDLDFLQWSGTDASAAVETFKFVAGKKLFFKARIAINEPIQADAVIGLMLTDTTMLDVTDGVFFQTDDGDALLDFHVEKNNTSSDATGIATLVADTYVTLSFYYNGVDKVEAYVNDAKVASLAVTNLPDDEELTISFGIQQGEITNVKTLSLDYIFVAKQR
jgi:hypothetical protein